MGTDDSEKIIGAGKASGPRRVIPLRDLASRANACGTASQSNQMQCAQHLTDPGEKFHKAVLGGAQLIASAIFHCTLAICERIDDRDTPALMEEIDKNAVKKEGRPN